MSRMQQRSLLCDTRPSYELLLILEPLSLAAAMLVVSLYWKCC